ncbi:hypothetical protein QQZ08_012259 [Neonectria magnoliae]|uniref:Uncharacterized protein n=1 Tax=Neonectria magnoliae TaxID=2732573 RepID=A0ABR1H474_9HYPO
MLPCEYIKVILLSVESSKHSLHRPSDLGRRRKNIPYESASVLHISNSARYSFIAERLLRKLLRVNYGSRSSSFEIDNDSVVHLQWHYPNVKHMETTSHLVLRDAHFGIILRKEDWQLPIKHWLMEEYSEEQLRERGILQPRPQPGSQSHKAESIKSEVECRSTMQVSGTGPEVDSEIDSVESESNPRLSWASTTTTIATLEGCPGRDVNAQEEEYGEGQQDDQDGEENGKSTRETDDGGSLTDEDRGEEEVELKSECNEGSNDEPHWGNIEVVDTDSEDDDVDNETGEEYWLWSPAKRQWFHRNEDDSLLWFPGLV